MYCSFLSSLLLMLFLFVIYNILAVVYLYHYIFFSRKTHILVIEREIFVHSSFLKFFLWWATGYSYLRPGLIFFIPSHLSTLKQYELKCMWLGILTQFHSPHQIINSKFSQQINNAISFNMCEITKQKLLNLA